MDALMKRRRAAVWILALLLVPPVAAQRKACPECGWADRGDRFEGVAGRENGGGCCEVLGVHSKRAAEDPKAAHLNLYFWLPATASPEIVVRQESTNYMMVPKPKTYPQGLQSFSWPRQAVVEKLGLRVDSLLARVRDTREVYYPALVTAGGSPPPGGGYVFILQSGSGIKVRCTIEKEVEGRLTPVRTFPWKEDFAGIYSIPWDGLNDQGKPVPSGTYALRMVGDLQAESIEPFSFILHFQHHDQP